MQSAPLLVVGFLLALNAPVAPLGAQQKGPALPPVRTFQLHHLSPDQAASLVAPYVDGYGTGVFKAGSGVHAITVRASERTLTVVDSLLRSNDRAPATITLRFRLIAADDSVSADPAIADIDSALRGLFRFRGYRLLGQGAAVVGEGSSFNLTISTPSEPRVWDNFEVAGELGDLVRNARSPAVDLRVELRGPVMPTSGGGGYARGSELSTGLTVPVGQTIVLGSAASSGRSRTIILAVRADTTSDRR